MRPAFRVQFDDEQEVRFGFDAAPTSEPVVLDNILPVNRPRNGTWISAEDAAKAWGVVAHQPQPLNDNSGVIALVAFVLALVALALLLR